MAPIHSVPRRPKLPKNVPHIIASRGKCWAVVVRMGVLNPKWSPNPKIHWLAKDCIHRNILNWSKSYQIIMFGWWFRVHVTWMLQEGMRRIWDNIPEIEWNWSISNCSQIPAMRITGTFLRKSHASPSHLCPFAQSVQHDHRRTHCYWSQSSMDHNNFSCYAKMHVHHVKHSLLHQSSPTIFYVQTRRKCSIS